MLEWRRPDTYTATLSSWNGGTEPLRDISQGVLLDAERPSQPDPRAHRSIHGAFSSTVPRLLEGLIGQLPLQHPQCAAPRRARHLWIAGPEICRDRDQVVVSELGDDAFHQLNTGALSVAVLHVIELPEHIGGGPADDTRNLPESLQVLSVTDRAGYSLACVAGLISPSPFLMLPTGT